MKIIRYFFTAILLVLIINFSYNTGKLIGMAEGISIHAGGSKKLCEELSFSEGIIEGKYCLIDRPKQKQGKFYHYYSCPFMDFILKKEKRSPIYDDLFSKYVYKCNLDKVEIME